MKRIIRWLRDLPRPRKIALNLGTTALAIVAALTLLNWPAWGQGAMERLLRHYLLFPSQIVYRTEGDYPVYLIQGEGWAAAGGVKRNWSPWGDFAFLTHTEALDGLAVLLLPGNGSNGELTLAVWSPRPEAVSAALELTVEGVTRFDEHGRGQGLMDPESFTAQAARREDGWFLFTLVPHRDEEPCILKALWRSETMLQLYLDMDFPCRLELLDAQGEVVERFDGRLPPTQLRTD